ncbi:MAG: hypothetical protein J6D02_12005, partial [Lachnospira sp.]|nr:hypothetical protein [Lachnospira sp.]
SHLLTSNFGTGRPEKPQLEPWMANLRRLRQNMLLHGNIIEILIPVQRNKKYSVFLLYTNQNIIKLFSHFKQSSVLYRLAENK